MTEEGQGPAVPADLPRALLSVASGSPDPRDLPLRASPALVDRTRVGERQRYQLQERIAELELRLRERAAIDEVHELEMRAMQHELDLSALYVAHLEASQSALHQQLVATQAAIAPLAAVSAENASLRAHLDAVQSRRAYRLMNAAVTFARTLLAPALLLRRGLRRLLAR